MATSTLARISSIFLLAVVFNCNGCSSDKKDRPSMINDETLVMSSLSRNYAPDVSNGDLAAVVAGNTEFALQAFPLLEPDPGKNIIFSPYSITLALALTSAGAKGETLSEIAAAMSFTLPQERLHPAFNKLDLLLASKTTGTVYKDGSQSPKLNVVNAVWAQKNFSLLPAYLDTIALNYGAGLRVVDYVHDPEGARQKINSWVNSETNSRIAELMPQGSINPDTRMVLTNAIWFKGNWSSRFPVESTAATTFFNYSGSEVQVPFMRNTFSLPVAARAGYQAVDIPYVGGNLSMLVLMPAPDTFDAFVKALTPAVLENIISELGHQETTLSLPKFSFNLGPDLKPLLAALGMTAAFDAGTADFSGITGTPDLFIQAAVHKAFISVDENGTEAAAATGIGFGTTGFPDQPVIVRIDHPFMFMIRDRQSGLILFMGKVVAL